MARSGKRNQRREGDFFSFLVPVVLFFEKNRPKPVCVSLELSGGYLLGGMDEWMKEWMDGWMDEDIMMSIDCGWEAVRM